MWNADATTGGLGTVRLESYGSPLSPLTVRPVDAPGYDRARYAEPKSPQMAVSLTAPGSAQPSQAMSLSAQISVPAGAPAATTAQAALTWSRRPRGATRPATRGR